MDEFGNVVMPKDITDVWMNEAELLDLFGVTVPTIRAGIKALCKSGTLREYGIRRTIRISDNSFFGSFFIFLIRFQHQTIDFFVSRGFFPHSAIFCITTYILNTYTFVAGIFQT